MRTDRWILVVLAVTLIWILAILAVGLNWV